MVLGFDAGGERFDKRGNLRNLPGILKTLKCIAHRELGPVRPPPGEIHSRLAFLLMHRLPAVPLLQVKIRAQLQCVSQISRGADKKSVPSVPIWCPSGNPRYRMPLI